VLAELLVEDDGTGHNDQPCDREEGQTHENGTLDLFVLTLVGCLGRLWIHAELIHSVMLILPVVIEFLGIWLCPQVLDLLLQIQDYRPYVWIVQMLLRLHI